MLLGFGGKKLRVCLASPGLLASVVNTAGYKQDVMCTEC